MQIRGLLLVFVAAAALPAVVLMYPRVLVSQPEPFPMKKVRTEVKDGPKYSQSGYDITPLPEQKVKELAARLTPEEQRILLNKGTERAFCGTLLDNKKEGTYICRLCGLPLFASDAKFDSGTGWPSFYKPVDKAHIRFEEDGSLGMTRVEILCARCDGHLGHVFDDGPAPTGLRFCLNSASLDFVEKGQEFAPMSQPVKMETAYFAGGCFWGVEDRFQQIPGVIDAESGYMGGHVEKPSYKQVCSDTTGHAETVKVVYDPARVSYRELLAWFFKIHDPTQLNRQGPDVGKSYRSAIFAANVQQLEQAQAFLKEQQASQRFGKRRIVTEVRGIEETGKFWPAEDYHQDYHLKHGGSCALPEGP